MSALATIAPYVKIIGGIAIGLEGDWVDGGALIAGGAMELYGNNTGNKDVAAVGQVVALAGSIDYGVTQYNAAEATTTAAPSVATAAPIGTDQVGLGGGNAVTPVSPIGIEQTGLSGATAATPVVSTAAPFSGTSADATNLANTVSSTPTPVPAGSYTGALSSTGQAAPVPVVDSNYMPPPASTADVSSINATGQTGNAIGQTGATSSDLSKFMKYQLYAGAAQGIGAAVNGLTSTQSSEKIAADRLAFEQQQAAYAHQAANSPMGVGSYQPATPVAGVRAVAAHTNVVPVNAVPNPVVA